MPAVDDASLLRRRRVSAAKPASMSLKDEFPVPVDVRLRYATAMRMCSLLHVKHEVSKCTHTLDVGG